MDFVSVRELKTNTKQVWETLSTDDYVVITNNGKPSALMVNLMGKDFEKELRTLRNARALAALDEMRAIAASKGFMTDEEIEAEIQAVRKELS